MFRKKIPENAGNVPEVPGKKAKNTLFPENLTRKWYIKKIPEIVKILPFCPGGDPVLDKVDKRYSISGISYEKSVQKKDPGIRDSFVQLVQISRMSRARSGTAYLSKRFVTCPVRCLVYRSIAKRHAM